MNRVVEPAMGQIMRKIQVNFIDSPGAMRAFTVRRAMEVNTPLLPPRKKMIIFKLFCFRDMPAPSMTVMSVIPITLTEARGRIMMMIKKQGMIRNYYFVRGVSPRQKIVSIIACGSQCLGGSDGICGIFSRAFLC
jgi:hypothetical protein